MRKPLHKPPVSGPGRPQKPSMRDVASAAQVGIATVSRVLNKSPLVTSQTTDHVLRTITELGYKAGPLEKRRGRSKKSPLSSMKHGVVCMLFMGKQNLRWMTNCAPVYAYAVQAAQMALNKRGVNCIIRHIADQSEAATLAELAVDGFLLIGNIDGDEFPPQLHSRPGVKMLGLPDPKWYDCVTYNTYSIGGLAAGYFFQRQILYTAVIGSSNGDVFSRRIHSFSESIAQLGGAVVDLTHKEMIRVLPDMNVAAQEVVDSAVDRLLKEFSPRPKGVFVTSDVIVPAVYRSLERRGVAPGAEIAIVSCNNEKAYLLPLHPMPVEIDIQAELIGQEAVERLLWRIEHPDATRLSLIIEPKLVKPNGDTRHPHGANPDLSRAEQ